MLVSGLDCDHLEQPRNELLVECALWLVPYGGRLVSQEGFLFAIDFIFAWEGY